MSELMKRLGIDKLTPEQRLQLVDDIWDSLGPDRPLPPMTPAQLKELERRIANHEANPDEGSTWEDVKAELMADE